MNVLCLWQFCSAHQMVLRISGIGSDDIIVASVYMADIIDVEHPPDIFLTELVQFSKDKVIPLITEANANSHHTNPRVK